MGVSNSKKREKSANCTDLFFRIDGENYYWIGRAAALRIFQITHENLNKTIEHRTIGQELVAGLVKENSTNPLVISEAVQDLQVLQIWCQDQMKRQDEMVWQYQWCED